MNNDKKARPLRIAGKGSAFLLLGQGTRLVLQLATTAIFARWLAPAEFGLMALVTPLISFLTVFRELGLTQATIATHDITPHEITSIFYINVAAGILLTGTLLLVAPLAAVFYNDNRLSTILMAMSSVFLLNGIGAQFQAVMRKELRFSTLVLIDTSSALIGSAIGVVAAVHGAGYWSFICLALGGQAANLIGLLSFSHWYPGRWRWEKRSGALTRFGADITGFNLINYFARNIDNLAIGKVWGLEAVGYYGRAYALMMTPLSQVVYPLSQVTVPVLSKLRADEPEYRRVFLTILRMIMMGCVPLVTWLLVSREWLIDLLLGRSWHAVVPIFLALGFVSLLQPAHNACGWLMVSQARSRDVLRWGVIGGSITIIAIFGGLFGGPLSVAIFYAASQVLSTPLLFLYSCRVGPVSAGSLTSTALPYWLMGATVGAGFEFARMKFPQIADLSPVSGLSLSLAWIVVSMLALLLLHAPSRQLLLRVTKFGRKAVLP